MPPTVISDVRATSRIFPLAPGDGTDAVHSGSDYAYAVTELTTDSSMTGTGLAFTLGAGTDLVSAAIPMLAADLAGREIEELMADFGTTLRAMADHPQLRWLGPHKGVVHLALASIVNAAFDLWAKSRGVPLWRLLLDLTPEALVATLDLSYLEDVLDHDAAIALVHAGMAGRAGRSAVLERGYPGYDTSVGWFGYSDETIARNAAAAVARGFDAMKLKVGSRNGGRDIARAELIRRTVGDDVRIMIDVNQQWTLPQAMGMCAELRGMRPYWIEEPTHPDDILGHRTLAKEIAPLPLAIGEHVPNRIGFKNYLLADAAGFIQVDCTRVAGVSEYLTVALLAARFNVPVVPHVGDMGQIHQHLVLFTDIALGLDRVFLEHIPHLREHFVHPADVREGRYVTPQSPGSSSDLRG